MENIDSFPSNVQSSRQEALLHVFEDNEAVIKMIMKRKESLQRDVFPGLTELHLILNSIESIWTQKIQIKYIDTKNQFADIFTKGNFTRDEWNHLLCLFNISHFSSINSLEAMSQRTQEDAG